MSESDAAPHPLRLAIDARDLVRDRRGIGTYARALVRRFAADDELALTLLVRDWLPARREPSLRAALGAGGPARLRVAGRVPRRTDVVWHPWNGTFFDGRAPAVATIHDVNPFAFPADDPARRVSQQTPFHRTAATARAILCDSAFTAREVERHLAVPPQRLHVVPLGVDPAFAPGPTDALPAPLRGRSYVLCVGAHDPHKNTATLAAGWRAAFAGTDVALVFTRPNPAVPDAFVVDGAPLDVLVALYRGAAVVAVPSIYEGFGLPLLEALACGAPALAARATSLPEVGGEAADYVDSPADPAAWARALRALLDDPARRAARARGGPPHAGPFTWERCAARTLAVLRAAARPT